MTIEAAGVVLHDRDGRFLAVHRPRRDDWSLPKGKLVADETPQAGAVRECQEETGVVAALGAPLDTVRYTVTGEPKRVRYWRAGIRADGGFAPSKEVDERRWCVASDAADLLTYRVDAELVAQSARVGPTTPFGILRHAQAVKRAAWRESDAYGAKTDALRPITFDGFAEADQLVPLLDAYGFDHVVSSPSRRCRQTVLPYVAHVGLRLHDDARLSEEGHREDESGTAAAVAELARDGRRVLLCTHRPVLGTVLSSLTATLDVADDVPADCLEHRLQLAQLIVLHRAPDGTVVAAERIPG